MNKPPKPPKCMRQQIARFCLEYLMDGNQTQAAIRAGYSKKTAYSQGNRLLKDAEVRDYVERLQVWIADQCLDRKTSYISQLWYESMFDPIEMFDITGETVKVKKLQDMPRNARRMIRNFHCDDNGNVTFSLESRDRARDKLMRHLGMFEKDSAMGQIIISPVTMALPEDVDVKRLLRSRNPAYAHEFDTKTGIIESEPVDGCENPGVELDTGDGQFTNIDKKEIDEWAAKVEAEAEERRRLMEDDDGQEF